LREGITDSIKKLEVAGVKTVMCTGDNLITAIAISKEAGILP
jgi:P-type E1-E2 ATPase